ncbi:enoyl-[acyl-carrier protein] reductase I [Paraburkholderia sp. WC7.3d]
MSLEQPRPILSDAKALVTGIANEYSIAYGCAKAFHELGAKLAITYANDKARPYVEPLATALDAPIFMPLDAASDTELEAVFKRIEEEWGSLDILVHSIAWAPKDDLQGGLLNCSSEGFASAMDVSCHSFVRMARLAAPLMKDGGTMLTMSFYGANKVVPNYSMMGPVKAALEACARYLAYELGPKRIRVHASRPARSRPARHRVSRISICCSTKQRSAHRSANWWTSWMLALRARFWRHLMRDASGAKRCISTSASTSWLDA